MDPLGCERVDCARVHPRLAPIVPLNPSTRPQVLDVGLKRPVIEMQEKLQLPAREKRMVGERLE